MPQWRSQSDQLWREAVQRYETTTGHSLANSELLQIADFDELLRIIDSEAADAAAFRQKHAKIIKLLRGVLVPVELISNIVTGGLDNVLGPVALVFNAVRYLIQATKNVSSRYDAIEEVLGKLQQCTVRFAIYTREQLSPELKETLVAAAALLLEIFGLCTKAIKLGRVLTFGRNALFGEDKKIRDAITKLDALTRGEQQLVGAETHSLVYRQRETLGEVASNTNSMLDEVKKGRKENQEMYADIISAVQSAGSRDAAPQSSMLQPDTKIHQILQPSPHPQDAHEKISKQRLAGTAEWVYKEPIFQDWLQRKTPVLWISGMPGAGKSFLSSSIVSYLHVLQGHRNHDFPLADSIGYFFFKDNDPEKRSVHQALCDVSYQICMSDAAYAQHVWKSCESSKDIKTIESAWRKLFHEYFLQSTDNKRSVYVVLDGIDEAFESDRHSLFSVLQDLENNTKNDVRMNVVLTGRPHLSDALCDALGVEMLPWIPVDATKNSEDIASYVESSIRKSRLLRRVSKSLQQEILDTLSQEANGMFLWVDLMIKTLNLRSSERAISEAMKAAPRGLKEMFHNVLEGLSESTTEDDANYLNEILTWVVYADRPLSLEELEGIVQYTSPTGDGLLLLERKLRKDWASFFVLDREDGCTTADLESIHHAGLEDAAGNDVASIVADDLYTDFDSNPSTTTVALAHASIGDFFRSGDGCKISGLHGPAIGVDADVGQFHIMRNMFRVLLDEATEAKGRPAQALRLYARDNWSGPMKRIDPVHVDAESKGEIGQLLVRFCKEKSCIEYWFSPWGAEFWSRDYVPSIFREWLEDPDLLSRQTTDHQEWIESTRATPIETFHSIVLLVAEKWLKDQYWIPHLCFQVVRAYLRIRNGEKLPEVTEKITDPRVIENAADWAGFEQDAHWNRRLAMTLRHYGLYDVAQARFERALELDSTNLLALAGLAIMEVERGNHKRVLEIRRTLVERYRETYNGVEKDFLEHVRDRRTLASHENMLAETYNVLGQEEAAFQARLASWKTDPTFYGGLKDAMFYLSSKDRNDEIMQIQHIMRSQKEAELTDKPNQLLAWFFDICEPESDVFSTCHYAARETNEIEFMLEGLREAIEFAHSNRFALMEVVFELRRSFIWFDDSLDLPRAIRTWKHIDAIGSSAKSDMMVSAKLLARDRLARYYFIQAQQLDGTTEGTEYIQRLEAMCPPHTNFSNRLPFDPALRMLGRWYETHGRHQQAIACFKPAIRRAIEFLVDEDSENDNIGYLTLAQTLLFVGDERRATAIYQKLATQWGWRQQLPRGDSENSDESQVDEANTESNQTSTETVGTGSADTENDTNTLAKEPNPSNEQNTSIQDQSSEVGTGDDAVASGTNKPTGMVSWGCSGECPPIKQHPVLAPRWKCRFCFDTDFCTSCKEKIAASELKVNICHPSHVSTFFKVQFIDVEIPDDMIYIDGKLATLEEEKRLLMKEWNL